MSEPLAIDGGTPVRTRPYDTERGVAFLDSEEEIAAVRAVLESRALFRYHDYGGDAPEQTAQFEERLRDLMGTNYALGVTSGTSALACGLLGLGVEEGDEVIIPAVTFIATVGAVVNARAVPVFAEVDESLNLDPASFEANITAKTKAVIPVHLYNAAADMDAIMAIARRHGVKVLEDAAQAVGVSYKGRRVGSIGDAGAFSLQLSKNITTGEGGALVTNDFAVHDRAARYQDQGGQFTTSTGGEHDLISGDPFIGTNLRMTEITGALARVQLERLDGILAASRARAREVRQRLGDLPVDWRRYPDEEGEGGGAVLFLRDAGLAQRFAAALRAEGIPAGRVYGGRPVYLHQAILDRRTAWATGCPWHCAQHPTERTYYPGLCPRSEDLLQRSLSIPTGPRMTDDDVEDVVRAVRKVADHLL